MGFRASDWFIDEDGGLLIDWFFFLDTLHPTIKHRQTDRQTHGRTGRTSRGRQQIHRKKSADYSLTSLSLSLCAEWEEPRSIWRRSGRRQLASASETLSTSPLASKQQDTDAKSADAELVRYARYYPSPSPKSFYVKISVFSWVCVCQWKHVMPSRNIPLSLFMFWIFFFLSETKPRQWMPHLRDVRSIFYVGFVSIVVHYIQLIATEILTYNVLHSTLYLIFTILGWYFI